MHPRLPDRRLAPVRGAAPARTRWAGERSGALFRRLGASLAGTGTVLSSPGAGGFLFCLRRLATMAQERLPFTALIVDGGGYGMLRFDHGARARRAYGVDLCTPDFVALAESFGVRAERVDGLGDAFRDRLLAHLADREPSGVLATASLVPRRAPACAGIASQALGG